MQEIGAEYFRVYRNTTGIWMKSLNSNEVENMRYDFG